VDNAPPLTAEQRVRGLRVLLSPVVIGPRTDYATTDGDMVEFRFQATSGQQTKA